MALPTEAWNPGAPAQQINQPANAVAITPSDDNDLSPSPRALFVGTGGDVVLILYGDTATVKFKNVPDGSLLPFFVRRVMSTNTTASNIVALW